MEYLIQIGIGILVSLVGAYIQAVTGVLDKLIPFLRFRNAGVVKIYKNQEKAKKSILKDIEKSKILHLLAMKGESFSHHNRDFHDVLYNANIKQRYLISAIDNPYLKKRGSELDMDMEECINLSVANFEKAKKKNNNVQIGRHKEVVRFRIILLSEYLYLSFQKVNIPGKKSSILKIKKNCPMYESFSSLFNDLWEKYCGEELSLSIEK